MKLPTVSAMINRNLSRCQRYAGPYYRPGVEMTPPAERPVVRTLGPRDQPDIYQRAYVTMTSWRTWQGDGFQPQNLSRYAK